MLFASLLRFMVREGAIRLIDTRGRIHEFGDGGAPACTVRLRGPISAKLLLNPSVALGEAYMDGVLALEDGRLEDLIGTVVRNLHHLERHPLVALGGWLRVHGGRVGQYNPLPRARRNVAHHYDLTGELYELFLDRDRQYSCAYFLSPRDSLETAQENKKRHIAAKLLLDRPGLRILDIGSGWGGLGLYLAALAEAEVTGITLSVEQQRVSEQRAREAGLADRARFHLRDYREQEGTFDRIVSVGMFEHVGKRNYGEFFAKVRDLLSENGVALLHSIGRFDTPAPVNPFIRKYIFPGTDIPSLSEVAAAVERAGLLMTDIEILRLHYAETLREWRRRFNANRERIAKLYDERFCRMWELYLASCEIGFRHQGLMVFQMQLAKRLDAVPLTRDYIYEFERAHAGGRSTIAAE